MVNKSKWKTFEINEKQKPSRIAHLNGQIQVYQIAGTLWLQEVDEIGQSETFGQHKAQWEIAKYVLLGGCGLKLYIQLDL